MRTKVSSSLSSCKWQLLCQPLLGQDGLFYEGRKGTVGQGIKIWATNWKQQGARGIQLSRQTPSVLPIYAMPMTLLSSSLQERERKK